VRGEEVSRGGKVRGRLEIVANKCPEVKRCFSFFKKKDCSCYMVIQRVQSKNRHWISQYSSSWIFCSVSKRCRRHESRANWASLQAHVCGQDQTCDRSFGILLSRYFGAGLTILSSSSLVPKDMLSMNFYQHCNHVCHYSGARQDWYVPIMDFRFSVAELQKSKVRYILASFRIYRPSQESSCYIDLLFTLYVSRCCC